MSTGQRNKIEKIKVEAKVAFLKRPDSYPDRTLQVQAVETHMSWVFLTDNYAYKLKKPVRYEYLDFSNVDARHHDCDEEIRVSRRLARGVYIGVLPLTADEAGNLRLGEGGTTIDWLVKMRRLPMEKMLDQVIKARAVHETDIAKVALLLAEFYRGASPVPLTDSEYRRRFEEEIQAILQELTTPARGLLFDLAPDVCAVQFEFLKEKYELLGRRTSERRIIEAHGDLRPEHICLEAEPVIIDSLEFKREFRILDPVDELSFLALECERLAAPPFVANLIFETYSRITGDTPPMQLVHFYKSYRAGLRAKLSFGHLREPKILDISKWVDLTREYLSMAEAHIRDARSGSPS